MLKTISLNCAKIFVFIFTTLILFTLISMPVDAGAPVVSVSASFSSQVSPGSTSQLDIVVSEIGGDDWIKDATVQISVSPSDGIYLSKIEESVARIGKLSSAQFTFPVQFLENTPPGDKTIHITVQYYEMDLFNIDTYGPYYVTGTKTFYVKNPYGSISFSSNPDEANVYLDDVYKGTTPMLLSNVPIGSHTIKLTKSGYNDISKSVTVSSGYTLSVSHTLSSQTGSISVSSDPVGSKVYLDETYKGTTPITLNDIPIGSHIIKLTKSGYNDISKSVTVSSGQTSSVSQTLSSQTGSISVSSDPVGSKVYLDETYKGTTPITLNDVPSGSHTIKLSKSGYNDISKSVTVSSGQTSSVSQTLSSQTGFISVSSDPDGSKVYLDETYKGTTPITLNGVPIGSHTIKLTKSGYTDISKSVTVSSGQTSYVSESFDLIGTTIPAISVILFSLFGLALFAVIRKKPTNSAIDVVSDTSSKTTKPSAKSTAPVNNINAKKEDRIKTSSAFSYKGAKIQYKIKVDNPTSEPIGDINVTLYVPDVFLLSKSTISITMLKPGESKTVTFEIRPTGECGDCEVSGKVVYYDYSNKRTSEVAISSKSLSIVCPILKVKEISESQWHNIVSKLIEAEESTREIDMPAETLFAMASRIVKDMHMHFLEPEITQSPQLFNGVARFYGEGVKDLKYAAQIEVVGGAKRSKLILKTWAEREDALTGFYHGMLDELEKRIHVKGFIDDSIVQNFYHYGDNIGTQITDSFVYKSNVGNDDAKTCLQCGKKRVEGEEFCSGCGMKF